MPKQVNRVPGVKPLSSGTYQARVFHGGREESRNFKRLDDAQRWQRNLKKDFERCPSGINRSKRAWHASVISDHGVSTKSFEELDEAISWLERGKIMVSLGSWVDPDEEKITFSSYAKTWRSSKSSITGKTLATYDSQLRLHIVPHFGERSLTGISSSDVRKWIGAMASSRVGATTIRQSYRLLRQILETAFIEERLVRNPCVGINLPKVITSDKRGLTREELNALAENCGSFSALVMFLGTTGLRIGEALALKVDDLDLESMKIKVQRSWSQDATGRRIIGSTKTGVSRKVPIPSAVLTALAANLADKAGEDWIFMGPKGGVLDYDWFRRTVFIPATMTAGLTGITIHSLRHTCASLLIKLKAPITTVSHILGHASVKMTLDTYGHYYEDDTATWIANLDDYLSESL
jgi:integrase